MAESDQEPLLLIAGLGQGAWAWRWVLPELSRSYRTIAFDNSGTGTRSELPARASVSELAADAVAALEEHGAERAHVVGLSMGGYVALTLALERPEVVGSLVLAGTGAGGPDRVPRPRHVADAFRAALGTPPEEFGRRTMPYTFAAGWAEANPGRFEEILALRLERPTSYEAIDAHANACYSFYRAGPEVERIDVPALVVHGDEDLIVPVENGRRLAERLPNAEYVELRGAGHNLPLEDPERFSRLVLDFLDRR
jgi:3-oxoadipate enol-lactonase